MRDRNHKLSRKMVNEFDLFRGFEKQGDDRKEKG